MNVERWVRTMAGCMILLSLALAVWHDHRWLYLTGFVGLNLLQSGFTNWCPAMTLLRKLGVRG